MDNYQLQLLSKENSEAFFKLMEDNRSRLEDFFAGTVAKTRTKEATQKYCLEIEDKITNKTYFPYLIIDNQSQQLVGLIDVKNIDWSIPKAELGAFIDTAYEGKGLIQHFGLILIEQIVAEHRFKKLLCRAASTNKRSVRTIQQLGFKLEGTVRRDYKTTKGELVDLDYYGRIFD
ncbi:MAG: GNAT family N-acetyltransferase [Flavobacteriales bacterium]|nr:GNAT family N-acetyltransferase [Flavobacteriales bacterium]